tara:strand:+ start:1060 stop:2028 length:969 start_codon:yes stop_codon:yes gene_type:complete
MGKSLNMKYYLRDNKIIFTLDAVRFMSQPPLLFDFDLIKGLDYRIIISHGIMGELLNFLEKDFYGLDKSKLIFLTNNLEINNILNKKGCRCFNISEYIFLNDDYYKILDLKKEYDCVYMGRRAKIENLFKIPFKSTIKPYILHEDSGIEESLASQYYNKARCGISPSKTEGSCRSVAEMLMCGLPVVNIKMPSLPSDQYYPNSKTLLYSAYSEILPNTLGGRELWLDNSNSIICELEDKAIDNAIQSIISKELPSNNIRENFLSKLSQERFKFLLLLKTITEELNLNFWDIPINEVINLPYSNCSTNTQEWSKTLNYFKTLY